MTPSIPETPPPGLTYGGIHLGRVSVVSVTETAARDDAPPPEEEEP